MAKPIDVARIIESEKDIRALKEAVFEINVSLHHIADSQHTIENLLEAKAAHGVEIKYLTQCMERVFNEFSKIDARIDKMDVVLGMVRITQEREQKESRGERFVHALIEVVREYWQVIILLATAVSFIFSYFFGVKVKD